MYQAKEDQQTHELYACLPFVAMSLTEGVDFGPIRFWPFEQASNFLCEENRQLLEEYLDTLSHTKAETIESEKIMSVMTMSLRLNAMTCVSIDSRIPKEERDHLLIEAIYQLYFCCAFCHRARGVELPILSSFTKILPARISFLENKKGWLEASIPESKRKTTTPVICVDEEIRIGIFRAFSQIYYEQDQLGDDKKKQLQSLIRGIRYFVDRFYERFENLIYDDEGMLRESHRPEDIIFLVASFESLLSIDVNEPQTDFKQRFRKMLELRYTRSIENLWKWVDGLYGIKNQIMQGNDVKDIYYRENPNFKISYFYLGMQLFLYAVHCQMQKYGLLTNNEAYKFAALDFRWVHPEDVLVYLWPEEAVLRRIRSILETDRDNRLIIDKLQFYFFTYVFVDYYEKFYLLGSKVAPHFLTFIPTSTDKIRENGKKIIELFNKEDWKAHREENKDHMKHHPHFLQSLKKRLEIEIQHISNILQDSVFALRFL